MDHARAHTRERAHAPNTRSRERHSPNKRRRIQWEHTFDHTEWSKPVDNPVENLGIITGFCGNRLESTIHKVHGIAVPRNLRNAHRRASEHVIEHTYPNISTPCEQPVDNISTWKQEHTLTNAPEMNTHSLADHPIATLKVVLRNVCVRKQFGHTSCTRNISTNINEQEGYTAPHPPHQRYGCL